MKPAMTRRDLVRLLAAAGLGTAIARQTVADDPPAPQATRPTAALPRENQLVSVTQASRYPARLVDGKVIQPERPLAVFHETDVLVVGGGPAGFAAAVAAARAGAKTALMERYGYFGGQWTGGLVLLVISTHARQDGQLVQVMRGIGGELLDRIAKLDRGAINYGPGKFNPTTDPEATKFAMDEMAREAGVEVIFHTWIADVIMEGQAVRGVVFESKSGRQAVLAKVVVDATGDGDVFAAAGAEHDMRLHAVGLVHRLGNVDRVDRATMGDAGPKSFGNPTPAPGVTWVNLRGPVVNCLDVRDLTRMELEHRRAIWNRVRQMRQTPGADPIYLLQYAPQLGVRISRLLAGVRQLTYAESREGKTWPDTIGVGGAQGANHKGWPIPYGALVPKTVENVLAAGRCVSVDEKLIEDMRLIAPCLTTGHAAGAAAALAVQHNCRVRDVNIPELQKLLKDQGAYLG